MRCVKVGGPLLGRRRLPVFPGDDDELGHTTTFAPIVTPPIYPQQQQRHRTATGGERFVLLPSNGHITVVSYKTGNYVGSFVLSQQRDDDNDDNTSIESKTIASYDDGSGGRTTVLLVACDDGNIREYPLAKLLSVSDGRDRLLLPQRIFPVDPVLNYLLAPTKASTTVPLRKTVVTWLLMPRPMVKARR